jgi:hypothetical protein
MSDYKIRQQSVDGPVAEELTNDSDAEARETHQKTEMLYREEKTSPRTLSTALSTEISANSEGKR